MEDCRFQRVAFGDLASLRRQQTLDLRGQVHDPLEERIELSEPTCLKIRLGDADVGYALLDAALLTRTTLLEFYLIAHCRPNAKAVLSELVFSFHCARWFVNTQDSFALPLLLDCGFAYQLDGYLFSVERPNHNGRTDSEMMVLDSASVGDLESTYGLIMQDGFYTGNGRQALAVRIQSGEIYLLRSEGIPIAVGFVSPLARTPQYADIAVIVDNGHRRQGLGSQLVTRLVQISLDKGLIPTALTSPRNTASRRTLEKCGFHLDGACCWSSWLRPDGREPNKSLQLTA